MAEKKVILKDGTDELLPKTSASMVFTESGQTVESALQNAGTGGGGTGGGIDEEQLAQYLQQHQYITQTALDEANYLKPTSAITGYAKASNYTSLAPTDTLNEALGKLEAGIGNGGGGDDDVYYITPAPSFSAGYIPYEDIKEALGGLSHTEFKDAIKGKKVYVKDESFLSTYYLPVSVHIFLDSYSIISWFNPNTKRIYTLTYNASSEFAINYIRGFNLNADIFYLSSDSNTDDISSAVNGESGLENIIQAVKDGNRLSIMESSYYLNILTNVAQVSDNGDMIFSFTKIAAGVETVVIKYTKSSNTFSCTVTPIAMGS